MATISTDSQNSPARPVEVILTPLDALRPALNERLISALASIVLDYVGSYTLNGQFPKSAGKLRAWFEVSPPTPKMAEYISSMDASQLCLLSRLMRCGIPSFREVKNKEYRTFFKSACQCDPLLSQKIEQIADKIVRFAEFPNLLVQRLDGRVDLKSGSISAKFLQLAQKETSS